MATEKEKMLNQEWYNPLDRALVEERKAAKRLVEKLNLTTVDEGQKRHEILNQLFTNCTERIWLETPFYCDYGYNIKIGKKTYFNTNVTILDCAEVNIGERVFIGPNVQIYTVNHPLDYKIRAKGLESAKPVIIEDHVWIGGGAIILPGVCIGTGSVIGAGSVVTKDVAPGVFAAGNPCRYIRALTTNI